MLDVQSLERRWLRYKLKRYIPYLAVMFVIILGAGIYNAVMPSKDLNPIEHKFPRKNSVKPLSSTSSKNESEVILEPSMNFMQTIDPTPAQNISTMVEPSAPQTAVAKKATLPVNVPLPKETILQPVIPQKEPIVNKNINNEKKTSIPMVKRDDAPLNINELQERFQSNPSSNLGLFIARYHYDHGNYPEAYNYALKTNSINNKIEDSWIIFSKSLIKMGKTDQARKTLELYISQSNSSAAKSLLDSLDKDIKK